METLFLSGIAILIAIFSLLILGIRFKFITSELGVPMSTLNALNVTTLTIALGYITPFKAGGVLGKPLLIQATSNTKMANSLLVTFLELYLDLAWQSFIILPVILIAGLQQLIPINIGSYSLLLALLLIPIQFIIRKGPTIALHILKSRAALRLLPKKIKEKIPLMDLERLAHDTLQHFYKPKFLITAILITSIHIAITPILLGSTLKVFNVELGYLTIFTVYWVSAIVGRVSFLPGGLGIREASLVGLLYFYNVNPVIALKIAALSRILYIIGLAIVSAPFILYTFTKIKQKARLQKETVAIASQGYPALEDDQE